MKKVLVLGAGLVARPLVTYLLGQPDFSVTVADVEAGRAAKLVAGHPRGTSEVLDIADRNALAAAIGRADLVVSMVPYTFHPVVAELAIEQGRPMVTASYVSPAMRALDARAKERYLSKLSGPLLDRIDLHVDVAAPRLLMRMEPLHEPRVAIGATMSAAPVAIQRIVADAGKYGI